jgi:hypothetical protein
MQIRGMDPQMECGNLLPRRIAVLAVSDMHWDLGSSIVVDFAPEAHQDSDATSLPLPG